jgi:hypothetical protein
MPWHIDNDNPDCSGFAVVKDSNGEIEGCHDTRKQAERQLAALHASEANKVAISLSERMDLVSDAVFSAASRLPEIWPVEVFDDHAIIHMDDSFFRVAYSLEEDSEGKATVMLAPFDEWEQVEKEWLPAKNTVEIKAITDDTITVAGYGVVFGGKDLEGETFTPSTDYMLDLVPQKLVMYDHGQNEKIGHTIGTLKNDGITADEYGLWIEAELDRHAKYVEQIRELAERKALGWSSGSVAHLTQRNGTTIKRWPVVEFSLTPTPAEPRTLGVDVLKYLAETDEVFEALLPEGDRTSPVQNADAENVDATRLTIELGLLELEVTR